MVETNKPFNNTECIGKKCLPPLHLRTKSTAVHLYRERVHCLRTGGEGEWHSEDRNFSLFFILEAYTEPRHCASEGGERGDAKMTETYACNPRYLESSENNQCVTSYNKIGCDKDRRKTQPKCWEVSVSEGARSHICLLENQEDGLLTFEAG